MAPCAGRWQGVPMADKSPTAGGGIIALTTIVGAIAGAALHQVSAGLLLGVLVGALIAVMLWLRERRRIGR